MRLIRKIYNTKVNLIKKYNCLKVDYEIFRSLNPYNFDLIFKVIEDYFVWCYRKDYDPCAISVFSMYKDYLKNR